MHPVVWARFKAGPGPTEREMLPLRLQVSRRFDMLVMSLLLPFAYFCSGKNTLLVLKGVFHYWIYFVFSWGLNQIEVLIAIGLGL